ncbi:hypothetical protein C5E10_12755 [Pseudoclavibacter sp. RFBG4]|nr:hypothetical protein C5E10_12755 [Pseudoclavibacter sp. RFBG4]
MAVPYAAASTCATTTRTFDTPGLATTFTVPAGAKYVDFEVRGAGGGAGQNVRLGEGAKSTGRIALPANASAAQRTFGIVVGQGGEVKRDGTTAFGGAGYGKGGASTPGRRDYIDDIPTGGGGGGSALLVGGAPLIVSGGGGGSAVRHTVGGSTKQVTVYTAPDQLTGFSFGTASGGGGNPNGRVGAIGGANSDGTGLAVNPALAGNGQDGGRRGGVNHYVVDNGNWGPVTRVEGSDGQSFGYGSNGGGNGGDGARRLSNGRQFAACAGGGGGGYAGGGGGGMAGAVFGRDNLLSISTGSGAAGSTFRASDSEAASLGYPISDYNRTASGLGPNYDRGHEGLISLSWCA